MKNKIKQKLEKGAAPIFITMMVMVVSLGIVLGLTAIFIGHLRIIRGMGDSVIAFYAANSGIERLLFEERFCRLQTGPCFSPCASDCFGLVPGASFSATLTNGASYSARFIDGQFESIGIFGTARRAIRVRR